MNSSRFEDAYKYYNCFYITTMENGLVRLSEQASDILIRMEFRKVSNSNITSLKYCQKGPRWSKFWKTNFN